MNALFVYVRPDTSSIRNPLSISCRHSFSSASTSGLFPQIIDFNSLPLKSKISFAAVILELGRSDEIACGASFECPLGLEVRDASQGL